MKRGGVWNKRNRWRPRCGRADWSHNVKRLAGGCCWSWAGFLVCVVDSAGNLNERGDDDETICEHSQIEQVKGKIISGKGIGRDVIARFLAGISAMTKSATTESGGVTATLPAPLLHAKSAVTHVSDPG
jgi:hypothetical protein